MWVHAMVIGRYLGGGFRICDCRFAICDWIDPRSTAVLSQIANCKWLIADHTWCSRVAVGPQVHLAKRRLTRISLISTIRAMIKTWVWPSIPLLAILALLCGCDRQKPASQQQSTGAKTPRVVSLVPTASDIIE